MEARHADKDRGQRPSASGLGLKHVMPGLSSFYMTHRRKRFIVTFFFFNFIFLIRHPVTA